ncbi:uncharacterized protein LOC143030344 [Oratosquilla oratoria]|uniref:uncharacterized protein LOC143030344 n=1 Tax=Oratosquilla oratoria TaxID=337810 RepID=UPI003F771715
MYPNGNDIKNDEQRLTSLKRPPEDAESDSTFHHKPSHSGDKCYQCTICLASVFHPINLKVHTQMHTGEKPYECTLCVASFSQPGHLQSHVSTHTGENPNQCTFCDSSFSCKSNLERHILTHTGKRPYKCTLCEAAFSENGDLETHVTIHIGKKQLKCTQSDVSSIQSGLLKDLIKTHEDEKFHKCHSKDSFNVACMVEKDNQAHTSYNLHDYSCMASFSQASKLRTHVNMNRHSDERLIKNDPEKLTEKPMSIPESNITRTVKKETIEVKVEEHEFD